jgi:pimeloyl-ACP methyl ester carboxylesterase
MAIVLLFVVIGHWSGSQPDRDDVAAASEELGVSFERRFVDVGEVSLEVVFAGPLGGPPVVLLHGFPEFWYAWRGPAAVLARSGYRVILPNQRGYSRSDKPDSVAAYRLDHLVSDVIGLIDALGHERVHLGCQDWGGTVGWRSIIEHPDRFASFAVIDAAHPLAVANDAEETISWYRTFLQIPWLPGFSARLGNWWLLTSNLRETAAPGAFPEEELDQFRSAWDRDGAIHSMGDWYRAEPWDLEGDGRVATRALVILAKDDAFIPASATRASLVLLEDGELLELGSGTHWVSGEEPERIGRILADFFGGDAPPKRRGGPATVTPPTRP